MRSLLRVGIRPLNNSRVSFSAQLAIVLLWILYGTFLLTSNTGSNDQNYLTIIFLALSVLYLLYILAQNTSIFGTQSYLEITPAYVVQKKGHFRPKQVIAFDDIKKVQILPTMLRFTFKNGDTETMDLKSIRRKKNLGIVKDKLQLMADRHRFELIESSPAK